MTDYLLLISLAVPFYFLGAVVERRIWTHRRGIVDLGDTRYVVIKTPPLRSKQ